MGALLLAVAKSIYQYETKDLTLIDLTPAALAAF